MLCRKTITTELGKFAQLLNDNKIMLHYGTAVSATDS